MDVKTGDSVLGEDGLPRVEKVRPIVFEPFNRNLPRHRRIASARRSPWEKASKRRSDRRGFVRSRRLAAARGRSKDRWFPGQQRPSAIDRRQSTWRPALRWREPGRESPMLQSGHGRAAFTAAR